MTIPAKRCSVEFDLIFYLHSEAAIGVMLFFVASYAETRKRENAKTRVNPSGYREASLDTTVFADFT